MRKLKGVLCANHVNKNMDIFIGYVKCERQKRRGIDKGDMVCRRVQAKGGGKRWGQRVENKVKEELNCLEFRLSVWDG